MQDQAPQDHAPLPDSFAGATPAAAFAAADAPEPQPRGFWVRLIAYALDTFILFVALLPLMVMHTLIFGGVSDGTVALYQVLCFILYPVLWSTWGTSPGKALLGMKVVHAETGQKLTFLRALGRGLGYIPSSLIFCLGFAWIGWDPKKQGWHDKLANTLVVARD